MGEIISVINQKGGVGKSTTAHAVGVGLANKDNNVLFIDLDAQGNLSHTMRATKGSSTLDILQEPGSVTDNIIRVSDRVSVIASSDKLSLADKLITETGKEYRLQEALLPILAHYDYIIIDTPPSLNILTINALTACNSVIIPAQADIYSLQGIAQLKGTIETVRKYCNNNLTIDGILITRYNGRSIIRRETAEILEQTALQLQTRVYTTKIRECVSILEAQARRTDIYSYAPRSNASKDYKSLVEEILERR